MQLKLYNTLTKKKEAFKPRKGKGVNMFVCGPTVYDHIHIGNGKTYIQFDVIARYLRFKGYKLFYLQNITDIDDKIIKKAGENNLDWKEVKEKYTKAYLEDMKVFNVISVDKYAKAADYIKEIILQVKRLIKKGFAYKISDGWYFDLSKDRDYGKLAGRTDLELNDAVSRIDENKEKRNKGDFCLWKFSKPGEPMWKSDLGDGRPGWHIEDTAITEKEFGPQYDIHGGGIDLVFPHHEAEIAQMESISGKRPFVKYWMHTSFVNMDKKKMSKSSGNFIKMKDLHEEAMILRYLFISNHYRSPISFSTDNLEAAKNSYERLKNIISNLKDDKKTNKRYLLEFESAMDDDFNTPKALQALWNMLRDEDAHGKLRTIKKMDKVFGLKLLEKNEHKIKIKVSNILSIPIIFSGVTLPPQSSKVLQDLVKKRDNARKKKDFKKSDELREKIKSLGFEIEDNEKGYILRKK